MKLAEVLSDLNTLRVCNHSAAIALVSARPTPPSPSSHNINNSIQLATQDANSKQQRRQQEEDPDLQRAKDLVKLHYSVKVAHADGAMDEELLEARRAVREALEELEDASSEEHWT